MGNKIQGYKAISDDLILPALGANPDTITFAGQSSGSYMTNQMQVIYSETIKGAGMMAGGPYMVGAIYNVTEEPEVLAAQTAANITLNFEQGLIDDPSNLDGKPSFVMIETHDHTVSDNQ